MFDFGTKMVMLATPLTKGINIDFTTRYHEEDHKIRVADKEANPTRRTRISFVSFNLFSFTL